MSNCNFMEMKLKLHTEKIYPSTEKIYPSTVYANYAKLSFLLIILLHTVQAYLVSQSLVIHSAEISV